MEALDGLTNGGVEDAVAFVRNFLLLIALAAALFFFAMRAGRAILVSLILSLYVGFALYASFPFKEELTFGESPFMRALSGLALFGILSFGPYLILRRVSSAGGMKMNPFALALLALATGGFVLALGYQVLDIASLVPLTPALDALFSPDPYFFWWCAAPLVGIFLTTRR